MFTFLHNPLKKFAEIDRLEYVDVKWEMILKWVLKTG